MKSTAKTTANRQRINSKNLSAMTISFYLDRRVGKKDARRTIYCRYSHGDDTPYRFPVKSSSGESLKVHADAWIDSVDRLNELHEEKRKRKAQTWAVSKTDRPQRVISSYRFGPYSGETLNDMLDQCEEKVNKALEELQAKHIYPSVNELKKKLPGAGEKISYSKAWRLFLDYMSKTASEERVKSCNSLKNKLGEFNEFMSFSEFDYDFYDKFTLWLFEEFDNNPGTINQRIQTLKRFLSFCEEKEYTSIRAEFRKWKRMQYIPEKVALSIDDLRKIIGTNFDQDLAFAKDRLLFHCFTAMRRSEVESTTPKSLDSKGLLSFKQAKTKKGVIKTRQIYLPPMAREIWDRYAGDIPKYNHNMYLSKKVREVCKGAGITEEVQLNGKRMAKYEDVSSHTGRRTFITIASTLGFSYERIRLVSGHAKRGGTISQYDRSSVREGIQFMKEFHAKLEEELKKK